MVAIRRRIELCGPVSPHANDGGAPRTVFKRPSRQGGGYEQSLNAWPTRTACSLQTNAHYARITSCVPTCCVSLAHPLRLAHDERERKQLRVGRIRSDAIAKSHTAMRFACSLVCLARAVSLEHLWRLPAHDSHQVSLTATLG